MAFQIGKRADLNPVEQLLGYLGGGLRDAGGLLTKGWMATGGAMEDVG